KIFNLKYYYPMVETFKDHLFLDTIRIQNLIWSFFSGMMVAIIFGFVKSILPPVNDVEIKSIGIGGLLMKPVVIKDIAQ
uniref:hypothetical protein n=1 Tax=Candidatus Electrothrix sp. TaxID=2170559 RepID=UPI004056CD8F